MLKIVVRVLRARPAPLLGEEGMGEQRFWVILGRKIGGLGVWRTRWIRRL